jgi:hypothetical protein
MFLNKHFVEQVICLTNILSNKYFVEQIFRRTKVGTNQCAEIGGNFFIAGEEVIMISCATLCSD